MNIQAAAKYPEVIVRNVFGEVSYTSIDHWDAELKSMFGSLGEYDETTFEEFQNSVESKNLELFIVLPDGTAIYLDSDKNDEFNIFSPCGEFYFQCQEIEWTTDLSKLVPNEFKELVKNHLYKLANEGILLKNDDTDFIVQSLTSDGNDTDWVLENHHYYRVGLWKVLEAHACKFAKELRNLDSTR